jgi:hypothetical protein
MNEKSLLLILTARLLLLDSKAILALFTIAIDDRHCKTKFNLKSSGSIGRRMPMRCQGSKNVLAVGNGQRDGHTLSTTCSYLVSIL